MSKKKTRIARRKKYWEMNASELAEVTAEVEQEFIAESFSNPPLKARLRLEKSNRKRLHTKREP